MKKFLAVLVLLFPLLAFAQTPYVATSVNGPTVTSLSVVTDTGAGTAYALPVTGNQIPPRFTWTVVYKTAAPTSATVNLEGSIDGTSYFTLDCHYVSSSATCTGTAATGSEMRHVTNKPVKFLRCNLAAYTAGSSEGVTCKFLASAN